jgi:hypothetical protein
VLARAGRLAGTSLGDCAQTLRRIVYTNPEDGVTYTPTVELEGSGIIANQCELHPQSAEVEETGFDFIGLDLAGQSGDVILDLVDIRIRERFPCFGGFEPLHMAKVSPHHKIVRVHAADFTVQCAGERATKRATWGRGSFVRCACVRIR